MPLALDPFGMARPRPSSKSRSTRPTSAAMASSRLLLGAQEQRRALGRLGRHHLDDGLGVDPRTFRADSAIDLRRKSLGELGELHRGPRVEPDLVGDENLCPAVADIIRFLLMPARAPRPSPRLRRAKRRPTLRSRPSPRLRRSARCRRRPCCARGSPSISTAISRIGLGAAEIDEDRDASSDQALSMATMIASTYVPSPPSGLPPHQASGTSSPTIWRTMSAAPSATSGECETMTMPTLLHAQAPALATASTISAARARAGIDVADRAVAEERGAAADRLHRHWWLQPRRRRRQTISPAACPPRARRCTG